VNNIPTGEIDRLIGEMKNGKLFEMKKEKGEAAAKGKENLVENSSDPAVGPTLKKRKSVGDVMTLNAVAGSDNDQFVKELQARKQAREAKLKEEGGAKDLKDSRDSKEQENSSTTTSTTGTIGSPTLATGNSGTTTPSKLKKEKTIDSGSASNISGNNTTPQKTVVNATKKSELKKSLSIGKEKDKEDEGSQKVKSAKFKDEKVEIGSDGTISSRDRKHTPKSKKTKDVDS